MVLFKIQSWRNGCRWIDPVDGSAAGRWCSWAEFFLYLFAGLPLKRVAATGIAHPRDQRRNLFMWFRALYLGGRNQACPEGIVQYSFFAAQGAFPPTGAFGWLLVMGNRDVVGDEVFDDPQDGDGGDLAGGTSRRGLPDDGKDSGKEYEEEEDDGAGEDNAENDLARRNAPGSGVAGRQRGRGLGRRRYHR